MGATEEPSGREPSQDQDLPIIFQSPAALLSPRDDRGVRALVRWGLAMMVLFPLAGLVIGIVLVGKRPAWGLPVFFGSIAFGLFYASLIR